MLRYIEYLSTEKFVTRKNGGEILRISFLKLKNIKINKHKIIVIIFGTALILSGLWTYEASRPVYEEKDEVIPLYTQHGSYTYSVPVTKENPLYEISTRLEMGKPAYFLAASPTTDMSFTYRLEPAESTNISGKLETMIVATGKGMSEGEEKIFWQKEFPLKSEEGDANWKGASVTRTFSIDVPEIQSMVKNVKDQLNYSQDAKIEIINRVNYQGKVNGENIYGTKDFAIPLVISSSYYQLPEKLDFSQDTSITRKVNSRSHPPLSTILVPLSLSLLSSILFVTTLIFTRMKKVEPENIEKQEKERRRSPFKEFVSRGKLPKDSNSLMKIEISSLQELVDAAVDMNSRVIYDAEAETYFIIKSGVMYIFFDKFEEANQKRSNRLLDTNYWKKAFSDL
ncbi:MAG: hypothetical protein QG646_1892 [Euryarchaeota archaeon]|nr:hypothetical protein [Euryarchaeota archaeon]